MTTRPVTMTSAVGGEPAQAGQGAGQPRLETSGGLLAAQTADGLDGIARGDDGDVELGDGDEPVLGWRTRHPDGLRPWPGCRATASMNCCASAPIMPAMIRAPASQPRTAGRWMAVASPSGLRSHVVARADPAPPRTRELPRSRRPASRTASAASSPPTARGMSRVHHRIVPERRGLLGPAER